MARSLRMTFSRPVSCWRGGVFAYALARTSGEPLLFKGDDFAKTDVSRVS